MYSNFVNFLCSWSSVDTVGIRGDGDGGKFPPAAGIGDRDGEKFGERGGDRGNSLRTFPAPLTSLGGIRHKCYLLITFFPYKKWILFHPFL
ncbi:hypothetical protein QL285_069379 [Trifolium repens]|nr:hypothetical protein QL285_069379 [Trifolium repens]